ncbi:MAG: NTP transferase domain-containing protein [Saprospiraceae bacterium]|jgi:molybdopterin-guanine dinucleotide biosynthesis protein A
METSTPLNSDSTHKKHTDIPRAESGVLHRSEWAFIGAPCDTIRQLATDLCAALSHKYQIAYADADHQHHEKESEQDNHLSPLTAGAGMEYTDKILFHRFDYRIKSSDIGFRYFFSNQDLVLVNGNHFNAKRQIVILDPRKAASLQKKTDRLTTVDLILLTEAVSSPYPFLVDHFAAGGQPMPPTLMLSDIAAIAAWIDGAMQSHTPPLYGLVLAGGKSVRMGHDKGLIDYHGMPQRDYMAQLLGRVCEKVFISLRHDQAGTKNSPAPCITDSFLQLGPLGAILSAFREYPNVAWLVTACDLPLLDYTTIQYLANHRRPNAIATAFKSPVNQLPEPLVAVWEPHSYPVLLQFLAQGYSCPRKTLINSKVHLVDAPEPEALSNVNYPAELEQARQMLGKQP